MLLGGLAGISGSRLRLRDDLAGNIVFADAVSGALRDRIDAYIARLGADAPAPDADPAASRTRCARFPRGPRELDLRHAEVATVISATGFDVDTGFVRLPVVGERGEIAQRDGATAVPGLFVIGQPWLRSRRFATISGVVADARTSRIWSPAGSQVADARNRSPATRIGSNPSTGTAIRWTYGHPGLLHAARRGTTTACGRTVRQRPTGSPRTSRNPRWWAKPLCVVP